MPHPLSKIVQIDMHHTVKDQLIFRYEKSLHYPDDAKLDTYLANMHVQKDTPSRKRMIPVNHY